VDRGCIDSPLPNESGTDGRMPNGGSKMDSQSKQKKQREELPVGVGNEDRGGSDEVLNRRVGIFCN
jgi:hypothetical protein